MKKSSKQKSSPYALQCYFMKMSLLRQLQIMRLFSEGLRARSFSCSGDDLPLFQTASAAAKDRGIGSSTCLCIEPEDIVIFMESFFNLKPSLDFFYLNCEVVLHDWGKTVVRLISPKRHTLYVYSSKPSLTVLSCNVKHGAIQPLIQFLGSVSQVKLVKIHVDEIPRCLSFPYPDLLIIGDEKILTLERMEKKLSSRNSDTKILQVHGRPVSEDMKRLLKRHEAKYVGLPLTIENVEQVYSSLSAPKSDKWVYLPHLEWA